MFTGFFFVDLKDYPLRYPFSKKEGYYTVEVLHPQVKEAQWTYASGDLKKVSGLSGEENHIKASIPSYINQKVIIYFLVDGKRNTTRYITKTNDAGIVNTSIKFDDAFKKQLGITNKKNFTLQFILEGEINGKSYAFKKTRNKLNDSILINAEKKIVDTYFVYDGNRVTPFTQVPYGAKVTGVVKTLNMVGKEVVLKVYKKNVQHSQLRVKTIVNNEGVATISFVLNKNWQVINPFIDLMDMFYLGMDGFESKLSLENGLNAVVGSVIKSNMNSKINDAGLGMIWGGKVSVEFRQKVVAICEQLWEEDKKYEMANALMIAMSVETGETFSSSMIRLTKKGYVGVSKEEHRNNPDLVKGKPIGLAQFTVAAVKSLILNEKGILENKKTADAITLKEVNEYKQKLALLSPEKQLDYVKTYLMLFNNHKKVKRPEDVYMIIFAPAATGKGDDVNIYKKFLTEKDKENEKVNPNYRDNATMDTKNDGFNRGNKDNIIQSGELLARYREMRVKGMRYAIDINETRKLNQVLAEKIIKGGRVTFANSHVSGIIDKAMALDNINDTSLGFDAKRSSYQNAPGGTVEILCEILYILYELSKVYKLNISEIAGASHSKNSYHYKGVAIDINIIDGVHLGSKDKPSFSEKFHAEFRNKVLKLGATLVLDPYNEKTYHYNHIHIEINK
ncbi:hypothetical protein IUY40_15120 [Flavobacterium sp. ALJ2]|uniref:hypothetical protein n=1 Tax=Flavobacterium sp. ALJ2 TaxID=2786960 RepID=UPI00189F5E4D|nr:hypothetical protein [Flavobacterium sp. ALJ2]MBF7092865.1 hypothetical protein [Flavobacterium sp. ALJ2]